MMSVVDNKLIINKKRSEPIRLMCKMVQDTVNINEFEFLKMEIKQVPNVLATSVYTPIVEVIEGNRMYINIPSIETEKFPSKLFWDIKGINDEKAIILIEGEINIEENVTELYD